ncbi:MAG TPA: alpha/beta hydrolase [Mycobacteriales bacterium]|nr:alpha/beta hydrolase [Mycobacteriales bacterium]
MSVVGPARLTTRFVDGPAGPLAVHDLAPDGEQRATVVLVPGYTGSKEDFAPVARLVASAGYRYVAMDLRGQYESRGPDDPAAYAVDALADDVLSVCAYVGGAVHLVGHSFGGLVTRAAVIRDPAVARSLTLVGSGPAAVTGGTAERAAMLQAMLAELSQAQISDHAEATDAALAARPAAVRAFLRKRFVAHARAGLLGMGRAILGEPDRVAELAATGVPLHVLHGADDDAWLPAAQREMATRLGATYTVIDGSVHSPAVEQSEVTAAAMSGFWAEVDSAVPAG